MLYVGKYYHERAKQLLMDKIAKTGYTLKLYSGAFPTKAQIDATTLTHSARSITYHGTVWDNYNNGLDSTPDYASNLIGSTVMNYQDIQITGESVIFSMQTMRSITAAVDGPITFFELAHVNKTRWASSYYGCSTGVASDMASSMSAYGTVYGIVGEVGTNNNLTVSKQNVVAGEQFYIHDMYFKFDIDVAQIKLDHPTLL